MTRSRAKAAAKAQAETEKEESVIDIWDLGTVLEKDDMSSYLSTIKFILPSATRVEHLYTKDWSLVGAATRTITVQHLRVYTRDTGALSLERLRAFVRGVLKLMRPEDAQQLIECGEQT